MAGYCVGVEHGTPRQDIRMVGDIFAVIPFDHGDGRVMFSRDNAHRNIGEQIAHDGTMPQRIECYFSWIERRAQYRPPEQS